MAEAKPFRPLGYTGFKEYSESPIGSSANPMFPNPTCSFSNCVYNRVMTKEMQAMLSQPWFIGALILALSHQVLQQVANIRISLIDSYLDPLLFMPTLLQFILFEQRFIFRKGPSYVLSWTQILIITAFVSIVCELLFPRWSTAFTADYIDVLCYIAGGTIFGVFFNNRPLTP